jgi:chorismate mutase
MSGDATRKLIRTLEIKTTLARIQQLFQERNGLRQKINEAKILEDLIRSTERELQWVIQQEKDMEQRVRELETSLMK